MVPPCASIYLRNECGLLAGQSEHALGDDVALDLRGPSGDGAGEALQPVHQPGLAVTATHRRRLVTGHVETGGPQRLADVEGEASSQLAPEKLEHRVLRRLLPFGELGEPSIPEELQ